MKTLIATIALLATLVAPARAAQSQFTLQSFPPTRQNDPTFDNAPAFARAIAQAGTNDANIYLPGQGGIYWIKSPIIIPAGKRITFSGDSTFGSTQPTTGTTIKLADGSNCDMLVKQIGGRFNLRGINFDDNKTGQTVGGLRGLWLIGTNTSTDRVLIENCQIEYINGTGIQNDNRETHFYLTRVSYCEGDGIVNTASSDVSFHNMLIGFNRDNGLKLDGAAGTGANSVVMEYANIYRNGQNGLLLTNASNNFFSFAKFDANNQNGVLITGDSLRNTFVGCSPVVNNYPDYYDFTPSPYPSGTYSNMRLAGTNNMQLAIIGGTFYEYESTLTSRPKYLFEDTRTGYYGTNLYAGVSLSQPRFTQANTFWVTGAYQPQMRTNASGIWQDDMTQVHRNNDYWDDLRSGRNRVQDQLEAAVGIQFNAHFDSAWLYRSNGPAYYLRARYDNPLVAFQFASSNISGATIPWTNAFNINSTNGYMAILKGETPAVKPLEVIGDMKAESFEGNGISFNAYYDGAWKYRTDGYAYYIQAQSTYGQFVVFTAPLGSADAAITFVPSILADETGAVTLPVSVSSPLLSLTALNTGTLSTTNGVIMRTASSGPAAATIGAGNAAMWLSNSIYLYLRTTADGISAADTLVSP